MRVGLRSGDRRCAVAGSERGAARDGDARVRLSGVGRILVIESDAEARKILTESFAAQGYRVAGAGDGMEGLYLAREAEVPYDVVLLDDHLPDATGLEMLPALRVVSPGSLLVFMSHSSPRKRFFEAMAGGAYEFLQKPLWLQEAWRIVARALRERRNGIAEEAVSGVRRRVSRAPGSRLHLSSASQGLPCLSSE